ncbi:MAG TPA: ABC transporter permease [Phycisphaeraceae bacterium]|nr:ABC transporter permease [Phycisphaeraceae bacterium]
MITQTLAIFHDAYRELNAKKLFWFVLIISGFVVLAFALMGINEEGVRIIIWTIPLPFFNSNIISEETFYKLTFQNLGIGFWLSWVATILALVSTAGMFPDFISSGSIDLMLSKPVSRLRLFLTKYFAGLIFVFLQVFVFCFASFLVIGFKAGVWDFSLFVAVPIVVCFFSYLFSVCVLLGIITKSTIASLLITLLVWFAAFGINTTEAIVLSGKVSSKYEVAAYREQVENLQSRIKQTEDEDKRDRLQLRLDHYKSGLLDSEKKQKTWNKVHRYVFAVKTVFPKTSETIALLDRVLIPTEQMEKLVEHQTEQGSGMRFDNGEVRIDYVAQNKELMQIQRSRSVTWILGTSLIFEVVVLGAGAWIFCRRDF